MAASLSVRLGFTAFRQLQSQNISGCLGCAVRHKHTYESHKREKRTNFRRTHAEVAQSLRIKQNFLHFELVDEHRKSALQKGTERVEDNNDVKAPRNFRFVMPEFMPSPDWQYRDRVLEKLERQEMFRRRRIINIPEFYVGSIMAVTVSDPYAADKLNRFVGICIDRGGHGLNAFFILRNVVDGLGVEVMYEMYNPTVHSVEVLKLEKRLDEQLYYLRNAPLEYSTFSFDMEPVAIPRGSEVPVNTLQVPLNPKPWEMRWERMDIKGIIPFELTEKQLKGKEKSATPWEKKDIMRDYRSKVNEDEEEVIMAEVFKEKEAVDMVQRSSKAVLKKRRR